MSSWRQDPLEVCGSKFTNATLDYHECLCKFDYRRQRNHKQALKYKHCLLADEKRKIDSFELYVIIAVVIGVVLIFGVAAFCSCKWYCHTNDNPCGCCRRKKRKKKEEVTEEAREPTSSHALNNGSPGWTPIRLVPTRDGNQEPQEPQTDTEEEPHNKKSSLCMKFCLSDPVQDCCEFFDCDIMWRKKNIYTIPVFGRRRPPAMQRRPTRPAPPPPRPSVPPIVKHPEPVHLGFEEMECEPIPEAPPSPEPVRVDQPRAMYVDPFAFLQKPFLKSKEKTSEEEPEALYSKMKDFVFGKKKSSSVASLNQVGVCTNPDTVSNASSKKSKHSKSGSLASLHNLSDDQLDKGYQAKRSMSLASLHMVEEENTQQLVPRGAGHKLQVARSRGSLHNICEDDIPPSMITDEYIDLEEMNKRIEAKMMAQQNTLNRQESRAPYKPPPPTIEPKPMSPRLAMRTPDFIPASAYTHPTRPAHSPPPPRSPKPTVPHSYQHHPAPLGWDISQRPVSPPGSFVMPGGEGMKPRYYPPVPATPEKPAVPARLAVGTPVVSNGTLGRPKPTVPPRPGSNSPKPRAPQPPTSQGTLGRPPQSPSGQGTLGRSRNLVKPSSPPPPPPVTAPIESAL